MLCQPSRVGDGVRKLIVLVIVTAAVAMIAAFVAPQLLAKTTPRHAAQAGTRSFVGPKHYYLAMGDSAAYGYQGHDCFPGVAGQDCPGYAELWTSEMQAQDPTLQVINFACVGESTTTLLTGGCPGPGAPWNAPHKAPYTAASQLDSAT